MDTRMLINNFDFLPDRQDNCLNWLDTSMDKDYAAKTRICRRRPVKFARIFKVLFAVFYNSNKFI